MVYIRQGKRVACDVFVLVPFNLWGGRWGWDCIPSGAAVQGWCVMC